MKEDPSLRSARLCAAVSGILFLAVLVAGGLRSAREDAPAPVCTRPPDQEIAAFAVDRNEIREAEIDQLQSIAADPMTSDAVRQSAQERIMELRAWMEQEATIADVLSARGYELPVVTVHPDSVNVVVRGGTLSREEAGVIIELVTRETGITGGTVKIIPIN